MYLVCSILLPGNFNLEFWSERTTYRRIRFFPPNRNVPILPPDEALLFKQLHSKTIQLIFFFKLLWIGFCNLSI